MKHLSLALAVVGLAGSTAAADSSVSLSMPRGEILIQLTDDSLAAVVGSGHKGVVRCYTEADKVTGYAGAGEVDIVGCYVGLKRTGKLVAPPPTGKPWNLTHLSPPFDGTLTVAPGKRPDTVQLTISGTTANALALWIDCDDRRGDVRCVPDQGMAGKLTWDVLFAVGKGGTIRAATVP